MAKARKNGQLQRYVVRGLQRGFEILRSFRADRTSIGAMELANRLKIPRSTVFRLLVTLEQMGFVERSADGREYRLGVAVLSLGFEYISSLEITDLARPILDRLAKKTRCHANLAVRNGQDVIFVLKSTVPSSVVGSVRIGTRLPAYATILGRMCLAYLDDDELERLYANTKLKRYSPQTPTSLRRLRALLSEDRKRGFAVSEQFFESGISAIAAPVFELGGKTAGAINIVFPTHIATTDKLKDLVAQVRSAARELSLLLNHRDEKIREIA